MLCHSDLKMDDLSMWQIQNCEELPVTGWFLTISGQTMSSCLCLWSTTDPFDSTGWLRERDGLIILLNHIAYPILWPHGTNHKVKSVVFRAFMFDNLHDFTHNYPWLAKLSCNLQLVL